MPSDDPYDRPLVGCRQMVVVFGFLITGSINTMTKKWQFQSCGPTIDLNFKPDDAMHCDPGEKNFHKPWTQNIQMFVGESLVLGVFLARQPGRRRHAAAKGKEYKRAPFYIFMLPACCDIMGTGVGGVGMLFISASVWQMMRGSLMVFAAIWSVVFLGKKQPVYTWIAVLVSVIGLSLVGCSAILDEDPAKSTSSNVPLGIGLTVVSQAFAAFQMVVEEKYVNDQGAPPEQVVGSEGIWGIMIMIVVLFVMYWIPGNDAGGKYENVLDSVHMLFDSSQLLIFVSFYLLSISFFNFFGVTIAGKLSTVHRTILDAMRTMIIWVAEIIVGYTIGEYWGTTWQAHSYLQLIGFGFLVLGNLIKNAIIKLPCVTYPAPQDKNATTTASTASSSQHGASLQEQPTGQEALLASPPFPRPVHSVGGAAAWASPKIDTQPPGR